MMTQRLDGTAVLITGASSGIGEATAHAFAQAGANVAIAARRGDRLEALAGKLREGGAKALVLEADITDSTQAKEIVAKTVAEFGRLDTLVNNAGLMLLGPIVGSDSGEWDRMMNLNVTALLNCTHAALPHLLAAAESGPRNVADIVNVSSVAGRVARNGSGVYNATKWAVNAFSESLRQEITRKHVRVALIEPGAVSTELTSHNRPEIQQFIKARFADMERLQADEIADAIAYIVTRARHVAINEILIRPTEQEA
jgi:NADP-dependent 3-hydroxy acid dehydrogenase YdfG